MNCIEWIISALEIGGYEISSNVLTADKLKEWAELNLQKIEAKNNHKVLRKYY